MGANQQLTGCDSGMIYNDPNTQKALTRIEVRAYTIAKAFYKKFPHIKWPTHDKIRPEWAEANCWIVSALYHEPGDPRLSLYTANPAPVVANIRNALRIRARERNDTWEWFEAHEEELRALETAARMLGKDAPQF